MAGKTIEFLIPDALNHGDVDVEKKAAGPGVKFHVYRTRDAADIPQAVWDRVDGLLCWLHLRVDAPVVRRMKRARILVRGGVGYDHLDGKALGAAGIPLCNVPDYGTTDVADMAFALLLSLARGIATYHDALRRDIAGGWNAQAAPIARRIRGQRFGIVGLGRIGTATALRAKAFGCHVMAFDPYLPWGQELALGVERIHSLDALLGTSDIVSIHTPLTSETNGLIGKRAFAAMKPNAILVNTARGPIVDLDALHDALKKKRIAGAGIDVLAEEPPPADHPLIRAYREGVSWLAGRLVLSPHAAWYTPESDFDLRSKLVQTAMAYLRNGELRNCVNLDHLARRR